MSLSKDKITKGISKAVSFFWKTRSAQAKKQKKSKKKDQGSRGSATGGKQMDGFVSLLTELIAKAGVGEECIFQESHLELPGYFRAEKKWDLLVVQDNQLIVALELKSHVGPSFGNNFNNRTEEAMGSSLDLLTAYREGALNKTVKPWLGYLILLEDCPQSQKPVRVYEPHFKVFPEFVGASYAKRYEVFCRKLMRENRYNYTAFLTSNKKTGLKGKFTEPAGDLTFEMLARSLFAQIQTFVSLGE